MNKIVILLMAVMLMASCTSPRDKAVKQINDASQSLVSDTSMMLNKETAMNLITLYESFANDFPGDSLAAGYLFEAGELAMNLGIGEKSIALFDRVLKDYPGYFRKAEVIFLEAFIYENMLGNLDKATEFYHSFIEQFPDHVLYKDAKASLEYMGKSLDEIIRIFEEEHQKADSTEYK
jgi:tetratricopeptide (TPR) repeat protein